jgi:hypothetical protein
MYWWACLCALLERALGWECFTETVVKVLQAAAANAAALRSSSADQNDRDSCSNVVGGLLNMTPTVCASPLLRLARDSMWLCVEPCWLMAGASADVLL